MTAAWEEPWSRLLAFRQHLPEQYEIHESLIRTYHELLAELEQATSFKLKNFRIADDRVRPKVVSVSYFINRRVNCSEDNFCERTNVLMKLDGLIHFLEPRLPQLQPPQNQMNWGLLHRAAELSALAAQSPENVGRSSNEGVDRSRMTAESSTLRDPTRSPKALISYSWDSDRIRDGWVLSLSGFAPMAWT